MALLPQSRFLDSTTSPHFMTLVIMAGVASVPMNIFLAVLPAMAGYFGTSYGVMQLAISAYLACNAIAQVVIGPLSDRFGRRPVLLWSVALFVLFTTLASLMTDYVWFMIFRCLQSVIVGALVLSRAVIRDLVEGARAAAVIGFVTMGMALVPMLAPALGGFVGEHFGWQAVFYLMAVFGVGLFVLAYFDMGESNVHRSTSIRAQFADYPELLRSRRFWGYTAVLAFSVGTFFAYLGGAAFVGEHVFGLSTSEIGLFLMFTPMGYIIGNGISGRYSQRLGVGRMITIGVCFLPLVMGILTLVVALVEISPLAFFASTLAIGLSNGMVLPNATAGALDVKPELAGSASGLSGSMMTLGGAVLSALSAAVLTEGSGAIPLLLCILGTALCSLLSAVITLRIERRMRSTEAIA